MKIMNYNHPLWEEFLFCLESELVSNKCTSDEDRPNTVRLLETWHIEDDIIDKDEKIDLKKSLEFFEKWGGYCDCEIMMNVAKGDPCEKCPSEMIVVNPYSENDNDKFICNICRKLLPSK